MASAQLLNEIINEKQIRTVYQPIYCLNEGSIYAYEGLSRPTNPQISNIVELINLADREKRLCTLDLVMLEQAIRNYDKGGKICINIEAANETHTYNYLMLLIETAQEVGICFEDIVLDLTERKRWNQESLNLIKQFKAKYNFIISIDDYGIDFADMELVLESSPEIVSIDRKYIYNIHNDDSKREFVKSLIDFAKEKKIKIVCEGIEEEAELKVIKELGADFALGFYLGRPL